MMSRPQYSSLRLRAATPRPSSGYHFGSRPVSRPASTGPAPDIDLSLPSFPNPPSSSTIPKPRLEYRKISSNQEYHIGNALNRKAPLEPGTIPRIASLHAQSLELAVSINTARAEQRNVGQSIRTGMEKGNKVLWLTRAKKLKGKILEQETALAGIEAELLRLGMSVPNDTHPDSPIGSEDNAIELERFGPDPISADSNRDHLSIALQYDWIDPVASATSTGNSWAYLKGTLAILEMAVVNYAVGIAIKNGWIPIGTPDVIKEDVMSRCGFIPRDQAGQTYHLSTSSSNDGIDKNESSPSSLVLAATAEIPLAALSANTLLQPSSLPLKYVGVGKAFRAEAGARGADTRGLYRLHQFTKVELFAVTEGKGSVSDAMMEEIRAVQKEVFEGLGFPVRVLEMPTEELGASAYRKYDMEAWMPGRGKWGEISSTSNCTDFQSRRLHIRHRTQHSANLDGLESAATTMFAHTLNGTCAAVPRLLIALVENGVRLEEDKVVGLQLPKALKIYWLGGENAGGKKSLPITWT